ncbi:MAG TPA: hypothetical protein VIN40_06080 [Candidatus Tyrphobacter sp.]
MPETAAENLACCALNARGEICTQPATYACSELHALCPNHAVKTTGRRKTDRRCRVCMREGRVNDVVNLRDLRAKYPAHIPAPPSDRPGECAAAYDSLHPCRRRAAFTCANGHGACRGHVGLQIDDAHLRRGCSICGAELAGTDHAITAGLLAGT